MKMLKREKRRGAQALIAGLIVVVIVFAIGAAVLLHSRSLREVTSLQVDAHLAETLADSGVEVAKSIIANSPCADPSRDVTYTVGADGSIHLVINSGAGTIKSTSSAGESVDTAQDTFEWALPPPGWLKQYNRTTTNDSCYFSKIVQAGIGEFAILGFIAGSTLDLLMTKVNDSGVPIWTKAYDGFGKLGNYSGSCYAWNLLKISGGFLISGYGMGLAPTGTAKALILKVDDNGAFQSIRGYLKTGSSVGLYPTDIENVVDPSPTSGFITLHKLGSTILLIRMDGNLDVSSINQFSGLPQIFTGTWAQAYSGVAPMSDSTTPKSARGRYIVKTSNNDGYVVLCKGEGASPPTGKGLVLMRINNLGALISGKTKGYDGGTGNSISAVPGGGYVIVGTAGNKILLMRTNDELLQTWAYTYDIPNASEGGTGVTPTSDGGFLVSGNCSYEMGMLMKTDTVGNVLWARKYDPSFDVTSFESAIELSGGEIIATGGRAPSPTSAILLRAVDGGLPCCSVYTDITSTISRQDAGLVLGSFDDSYITPQDATPTLRRTWDTLTPKDKTFTVGVVCQQN